MAHRLTVRFTTEQDGKYFSLNVDNVKEDENGLPAVTEAEINTLMDLVIAKKIFVSKNGALTGKKDAKIVSTTSQEFDLK